MDKMLRLVFLPQLLYISSVLKVLLRLISSILFLGKIFEFCCKTSAVFVSPWENTYCCILNNVYIMVRFLMCISWARGETLF